MIKIIQCLRRAPGITLEEFQDHWRRCHAALLCGVVPLRAYVQYHTEGTNPMNRPAVGREEPHDGFAASWWDGEAEIRQALEGDSRLCKALEDLKTFTDPGRSLTVLTVEHVITEVEGQARCVLVEAHRHGPSGTRAHFQQSWLTIHGGFGRRIQAMGVMSGYLQNHVVEASDELVRIFGLDRETCDGVGMAYYESAAILRWMSSLPVVLEAFKEEVKFTDHQKLVSALTRRHAIKSLVR